MTDTEKGILPENIDVSFLPTEEDYVYMNLEKEKYLTPKANKIIFRIIGMAGILSGTAGLVLRNGNIIETICFLLLITVSLFVISFYDVIRPYLVFKSSSAFFRYNEKDIISKNLSINDKTITVNDELHRISIPKEYIYEVYKSKRTLFIFLDKEEFIYIPLRVLNS